MSLLAPPPPKVAPPNYAAVLATFGQSVWGPNWPSGIARFAGINPRTMTRIAGAVAAGRDYPAARGVLAGLYDRFAPIVAELRPWSRHAAED